MSSRAPSRPPAARCLAVAIQRAGKRQPPSQCTDASVTTVDGVPLCWCHYRARLNPHRPAKLELAPK